MDTDSFVLSVRTKDIIEDLKNVNDLFNLSNLSEKYELLSKKTPNNFRIYETVCLRSKMYAFNCGSDCENELKSICKSH